MSHEFRPDFDEQDRQVNDPLEQLRAELSVKPSPEFAAKVRARVAREPKRRWAPMIVWSVAAAAATIVLGVMTQRPVHDGTRAIAVSPVPTADVAHAPSQASSAATQTAPVETPRHLVNVATPAARPDVTRPATFEVLVPNDQRLAIDRLLKGLNDGRLDPAALSFASADQQAELAVPAPIAIAPIEIPSIGGIDIKRK